ncbi:LexA family protein [Oceanobacillus neutriphilus]|uniref:Transcriptional regulator n=1 Tax=Oceanobacillus neutriphilus TaxID=531815 RepID=A0ABQ2P3K1_9BACI|nr:S24 family peptidase [Oceanobacillus neutriphilus]GGP17356.1 transcriptional regulator [Oceanobacillus neutriphilus]
MKQDTSSRLKQLMKERNLKQVDILNKSIPYQKKLNIKMGKSTLSQYVNGKQSPDQDRIYLLSKTLKVNEPWLMGYDVSRERTPEENRDLNIVKEPTEPYYFFPTTISAGLPFHVDGITEDNVEQIEIPDAVLGKWAGDELFITKVNGDSMNKIIPDKSLIAVKPVELHQLKEGDIVVYSNGGDFSVKRFYLNGDEIVFRPDSHDSSFFEQRYNKTTENITIHGKVVVYIVELD